MKEEQTGRDRHLDSPSEANREKHINFTEVEQESPDNGGNQKGSSERQKQWQQEIEEGEREQQSNQGGSSAIPLDNDDTIGVP